MFRLQVREKILDFYKEDIGSRDLTSDAIFSAGDRSEGKVFSKEEGVICGSVVFLEGWKLLDETVEVNVHVEDGQWVDKGEELVTVKGCTSALLSGERVLLNLVQRMSGIATVTRQALSVLADSSIRVCDTRKTMPGLRLFDKYAVQRGGGWNHRFGLDDAVMIKDNHIAAAGGITEAVELVKRRVGHMVKVEVETTTEAEVLEAVQARADVIMFDNCGPARVKELVQLVPDPIVTEVSGNIGIENIADYHGCGVDYLSMGALTHSVPALDISFLVEKEDGK
ncbi:carboxylating nicotinate-nucleotide diphosphorylase [Salibacterium salarium]|uniref:Probable nicotinate-nucleotide pyrophosphorylase [carboxylating] n=1 Tax=Salibacterium salarium TaxID=284579 RepID=A0A3R9Q2D7_9BACI|nr:carboxylating nicotinate-nucleotide diphosphorylase [Salibacterium salarium]RSL32130.1 carboxylating nicotinate-nucleotide diphosphorylase [Salibacterium salarium]